MSKDLTVLAENRDVLLTAEIAAWLHMLGKYTKEFIDSDLSMSSKLPNSISKNLRRLFKEDLLKNSQKKLPVQELQTPLIIEEFISKHELGNNKIKNDPNAFNKLMNDAHGRGSGTEKGVLKSGAYSSQHNSSIRISTAFGYEEDPIDVNEIDLNSKDLYIFIESAIIEAQKLLQINKTGNFEKWNELRIGIINAVNQHFTKTIGDTRRPINDVTLWDQTVSSVAFFKAELAEGLINGYKDPFDENSKYTFRYLHMTFNGEEYLAKGIGIGDIASRRKLIDEAFDGVKLIIEVEYPLGLEIYRDINGITFLIPKLSEKLEIDDLIINEGVTLKQRILDEVIAITKGEITPYFYISEKSSRNLYNLGSMISKKTDTNIPSLRLQNLWIQKAELCSSCCIKPVDSNSMRNKQKRLCQECSERITGRAKQWLDSRKEQTIWIDEIADSKGKIALLSFGFNLNSWIGNADSLSTFRNLKKTVGFSFAELMRELTTPVKLLEMQKLKSIGNKYVLRDRKTADGLYNFMVGSEDLEVNKELTKYEKLALSIWRKPPSFARVRRVWETTSKFWGDALADIRKTVGMRDKRLILKIQANNLRDLNVNNAYEVKVNGIRFTVFYEANNPKGANEFSNFVIIENLELLAKKLNIDTKSNWKNLVDGIKEILNGKNIDFYNSNSPTKKLAISRIGDIEIESCSYSPVIEITKDPERFMVLVPANKALKVAKKIKKKYEKEMGKVRNRLPMNLGIVYARYHTALPAIIDAGRRFMRLNNKQETWRLAKQPDEFPDHFKLSFENGQIWKIPSKMGDGSKDIWYPYFYVVNNDKAELENRSLSFKGPSGEWLIHVSELKIGDEILVIPSYFDFEYLSSASQRFEISYNDKNNKVQRRSDNRKQRPYYLDDLDDIERVWATLSTKLPNSQIKKLNSLVEKKRRDWASSLEDNDEVFKAYVEYVVGNLKWKPSLSNDERKKIIDFCVNGKLSDVLEIHMSILKDKTGVIE